MKKEIHPKFNVKAKITCACGANYEIGSTSDELQVELCAKCHPFYTGTQKIVDTARRVEKFQAKVQKAAGMTQGGKKAKKEKRLAAKQEDEK